MTGFESWFNGLPEALRSALAIVMLCVTLWPLFVLCYWLDAVTSDLRSAAQLWVTRTPCRVGWHAWVTVDQRVRLLSYCRRQCGEPNRPEPHSDNER